MLWQTLSAPWQTAASEAWTSYCQGSLPHGAVLTDAAGNIVSQGRNRIHEREAPGTIIHGQKLAHAELNTLLQTDWNTVNRGTVVLYSTIEPCAMCVGAIRMANVREIHYAARDTTSGGLSLLDKTPFLVKGQIRAVHLANATLEIVLLALLIDTALNMTDHPAREAWAAELASQVPAAGVLGNELYASRQLRLWAEEGRSASFVFDTLAERVLSSS
jgi:tRNA(Arg) A34 adenosine deaminase TadA